MDFKAGQAYLERLYSFKEMVANNPYQLYQWEGDGGYLFNNGEHTYHIMEYYGPEVNPDINGLWTVIIERIGLWQVDLERNGVYTIFESLADAVNAIPPALNQ